ncbi:hypothetical protein A5747_13730 [Mycobacterium sp. IS-836]|uniref:hypothetical protein n=1 Tax=Mycobacterium sp. IS-836 TaxID=1834160 RepID=UPI00096CB907|nr:hypothetical protein [Mycobacterium sp. IS-836]OMC55444.1 hypothetical protein A5747_13730 [Mycobacterium sp. IS-836]
MANPSGFDKAKKLGLFKSNSCLAKQWGVDPATVSRVLRGRQEPGRRVLAGSVQAFGQAMFFELFRVIP